MLNFPYIWAHARRVLGLATVVLWTLMMVVGAKLAVPELSRYTWAINGVFLVCIIVMWQTSDYEVARRQQIRAAKKKATLSTKPGSPSIWF